MYRLSATTKLVKPKLMRKDTCCKEFLQNLSRRGFVKAGFLGLGALNLSELLRKDAQAGINSQKSVIILWMRGGPSQHETFDPKPFAPSEYRGAFNAINTSVPGIQICEHLPLSAKVMDHWSIIRSLHHGNAGHSAADQICFTGYPPGQNADQNYFPSCGAIVSKELGGQNPKIPSFVMIPKAVPGVGPAFLGNKYAAFQTINDPSANGPFIVPNFELADGLSVNRLADRRELGESLDTIRKDIDNTGQWQSVDKFKQQSFDILLGGEAREAFDLDSEPDSVRSRYGCHLGGFDPKKIDRCGAPSWGQRILLARRLVERGVRLVTVDCRWWDTHVSGFESMKDGLLPRWDMAFSALIEDLHQRGLLKNTMVVAWGEFGRTPKVNASAGRDHWPNVFSAAIAGGRTAGGRVIGSSDDKGAEPKDNPKTPQDVLATIYDHLGIDTSSTIIDNAGRPHPILSSGSPISELY